MSSELALLDILVPPPQIGKLDNVFFLSSVRPNDANKFKLRVYGVCVCVRQSNVFSALYSADDHGMGKSFGAIALLC